MYIGASFTRTSFDPVSIWLIGNEAGWTGDLYFTSPKTGQEFLLFNNKSTPNQRLVLSATHDIGIGDTVYFVYKVRPSSDPTWPTLNSQKPKWTGLNLPGVSKYVTAPSSAKYGHRWSVAGRVNDSLVQFGFEDNVENGSDMDFDDIIFGTTLSLANAEVPARLNFTDKAGKILTATDIYSPANDTIFLTYTDDFTGNFVNGANPDKKEFLISVVNRKGAAAADNETILTGVPVRNGITGNWSLAIPIQEKPGIPGDKILQSYFLGEITASVRSHNRTGVPDGNTVTASLKVAYADKPETVKIVSCPDSAADITRTTTCISIRVNDQSFTRNLDTVWAEVKCDISGDVIGRVPLFELPDGSYKSGDLVKNETTPPGSADQVISCKTTDNIVVTYADEVYNTRVTATKSWSGNAPEGLNFALAGNPAGQITEIKDGDASAFLVVIKGPSATIGVKDEITVTLTSPQGESESFKAVETEVNSNVFTVEVPFAFQTTPAVSSNSKIEGFLDPNQPVTAVPVTGVATINGKPYTAVITLKPALNLVKNAYIKDSNGDGRGDKVYVVFSRPLEVIPSDMSPTYWNQVSGEFDNTKKPLLSILQGSPYILVADFSADPFPKGATSIPAGHRPFATLPSDNIFGAQKPAIADSMGPIIDSAKIRPFNNLALVPGTTDLNVDTVVIFVSEKLATQSNFDEIIRFSKPVNGVCSDYTNSSPVITHRDPVENGDGTFTILVATGKGPSPIAGDCVFLNANGSYTDMLLNKAMIHGEPLKGPKPPREIELFRGYPPVAGLNAGTSGFVVVNNDPQGIDGSEYSGLLNGQGRAVTVWVPPADFPADYKAGASVYVASIPALLQASEANRDAGKRSGMPLDISTVQVISTGEYIAYVSIFDNLGNSVKTFQQAFGYRGELNNQERAAKRGLVSYLVWDMKNQKGSKAGQGVYVWKVVFHFKTGKQEIRYTRTGLMRNLSQNQTSGTP
ncbi:MAG: hypothetical protein M3Y08_00400 [Fibrobacterota bacterium]|nr:hypothetical protein [Fibrobacterota bacterium]